MTLFRAIVPVALCLAAMGCKANDAAGPPAGSTSAAAATDANGKTIIPVTITSANGNHVFKSELAKSPEDQERGLMFRTGLADDFGMLFWPYPPNGPPREARFWMKNTPSSLDIIFIRADGTIATIAENAVPYDETELSSGEPVASILEIKGGRAAALGIAEGDRVSWPR